jgi:ubiquinone/menaquinone biosynthesis C-methylase UbiE
MATFLGSASAQSPTPAPNHRHEHGAANQFMHQADFDQLVARFDDPARAEWQKPDKVIASLEPLAGKTVADIGGGTGYFAFPVARKAEKVIAIDIDPRFLDYIEHKKQAEKAGDNIDTRLTTPDSPGLEDAEADLVLIVNTIHHIENRIPYLRKLKQGLRKGGSLVIIDFQKQETPVGPPVELRLGPDLVKSELEAAGFKVASIDLETLPYQYVIKAQ